MSWTAVERDTAGIVRQSERTKQVEGGRIEMMEERQECTDEETKYPRIVANTKN
jgi:hypothetical protein